MLACRGRVQAANGVIHVVAEHLIDHSDLLRKIGGSNEAFVIPAGRGDEAVHSGGAGIDSRDGKALKHAARDIYVPDLHIDTLNIKAPEFSLRPRRWGRPPCVLDREIRISAAVVLADKIHVDRSYFYAMVPSVSHLLRGFHANGFVVLLGASGCGNG